MIYAIGDFKREDHQPLLIPTQHPNPDWRELESHCSSTVAVITALEMGVTPLKVVFDDPEARPVICDGTGSGAPLSKDTASVSRPLQLFEGKPLIAHAVRCGCDARVRAIRVLAASEEVAQAAQAAYDQLDADTRANTSFSTVVLDAKALDDARRITGGIDLIGIPPIALKQGAKLLGSSPDAKSLLVMSCDQVRILPRHLLELHKRLEEVPEADLATSWIQWLRRTPVLFSRSCAERLANQAESGAREKSVLSLFNVEEVVFGEERLAANPVIPASRQEFQRENTLSALEAVRMARGLCSEKDPQKVSGLLSKLNKADRLLVDTAKRVVSHMDSALGEDAELRESVSRADDLGKRSKLDFPIFSDKRHKDKLVYLDMAATGQRLGRCLDAQEAFDKGENANIYRGCYSLSMQATLSFNDAREKIEGFIGAESQETVFTQNTTDSCNRVAQSWGDLNVNEGDLIVVSIAEHHSNLMPWMLLVNRRKARLAYIPVKPDGRLDQEEYDKLLEQHPKIVCVAHVGNVLGIVNPVSEMARKAHEVGARFMVDAAQSIAHIPLNVKELGADFVAFSGHKLYGPLGIGCLWISPEAFQEMDPSACGGGTVSHVSRNSYYLKAGAIQYEGGTPPISQAIGLAAAMEYLDRIGMDEIASHDKALTKYLLAGLEIVDGVKVFGDHRASDGSSGLVSVGLPNAESAQVGTVLGNLGVAVRSGGHCALPLAAAMGVTGTTRFSFGVHTTKEDIEAAITALALCADLYSSQEILAGPCVLSD